ncbi:MAG: hypothetical protein M1138_01785 [Candidatus Thermoplasmatota archaeon]|jgi:hypothetical protein|nr:hypothetical protein [Candidatus Thermoplasmatota archaeon]
MFSTDILAGYVYGIVLGLILVLSLFLLVISVRAYRKSGVGLVKYLLASFVVILIMDAIFIADYFTVISVPFSSTVELVLIVILLLFYAGIMRGLS